MQTCTPHQLAGQEVLYGRPSATVTTLWVVGITRVLEYWLSTGQPVCAIATGKTVPWHLRNLFVSRWFNRCDTNDVNPRYANIHVLSVIWQSAIRMPSRVSIERGYNTEDRHDHSLLDEPWLVHDEKPVCPDVGTDLVSVSLIRLSIERTRVRIPSLSFRCSNPFNCNWYMLYAA